MKVSNVSQTLNEGNLSKHRQYVIFLMRQVGFKRNVQTDNDLPGASLPLAQTRYCTVCCVAVLGTAPGQDGRETAAGKMLRGKLSGTMFLPVHLWCNHS